MLGALELPLGRSPGGDGGGEGEGYTTRPETPPGGGVTYLRAPGPTEMLEARSSRKAERGADGEAPSRGGQRAASPRPGLSSAWLCVLGRGGNVGSSRDGKNQICLLGVKMEMSHK